MNTLAINGNGTVRTWMFCILFVGMALLSI